MRFATLMELEEYYLYFGLLLWKNAEEEEDKM